MLRLPTIATLIECVALSYTNTELTTLFQKLDLEAYTVLEGSNKESVALASIRSFLQALRADGWEFSEGKLIPTTPEPAVLAPEITRLQQELQDLEFTVAGTHYQQALDNFRMGLWETSNGALRSFLENLYTELCRQKTDRFFANPGGALQHLHQTHHIEPGEYILAKGLLDMSNTHGAHHGISNPEEALFRFHFSTALGRYLLTRLKYQ